MPRGRRMSSEWITASPSQVWFGPGGCLVEVISDLKRDSVSAGEDPRSTAMSLVCILFRPNPDPIILTKNCGGLILAVAVMWAATSCTVQPSHSDVAAHC